MTLSDSYSSGSKLAPPVHIQLEEKQRELHGLLAIRDLSRGLHNYLELLCERIDELNDGYEAISHVMCNWQNVFRGMNLIEERKEVQRMPLEQPDVSESPETQQSDNHREDPVERQKRAIIGTQLVFLPLHGQDTNMPTNSSV